MLSYTVEKRVSKTPEKFGTGMIAGVASPEASSHSKTQVDFIPTMSLGIPGDAVMALILGALMIQGIAPGPQLISDHPDIFWGLIASFWIGNVILMILNVPMIGMWVKLLQVPYRYLFPSAMFFIAVGVFSTQSSLFQIWEVLAFGLIGALLAYMLVLWKAPQETVTQYADLREIISLIARFILVPSLGLSLVSGL